MNLRKRGRRGALTGAGAAGVMAAAVFVGPAAVASPAHDAGRAADRVQEQVEQVEQATGDVREQVEQATDGIPREAEQALDEAQQGLDQARRQAEQAAEEAQDRTRGQDPDVFGDLPEADPGSWLPEELQRDLQGLQDLPAGERAEELEDIVHSALSGHYGDEVETWTERVTGMLSSLPQDMRQDIQQVIGQEPEEARADVRQIVEKAVGGEYGEDVEMWADWLRHTFQRWDLARAVQGASGAQGSPHD